MVDKKKPSSRQSVDEIISAAKNGLFSIVKRAIEADKRLLNCGHGPSTLLKTAISVGQTQIVKYLVGFKELDVNLCAAKITKDTPRCTCCPSDDNYGGPFPPLYLVAVYGHVEIVKLLLDRQDTEVNFRDDTRGLTALSIAAYAGHAEVVKLLLRNPRVNVNMGTKKGTDLHEIVKEGNEEITRLFLNHPDVNVNGISLNNTDQDAGFTPLHYAAQRHGRQTAIVKLLLAHKKIDVNARSPRSPLMLAIQESNLEIAKLIIKHKDIDVNIKDGDSWSLLHVAVLSYKDLSVSMAIIRLLLAHKDINVNSRDDHDSRTPFYSAVRATREDAGCVEIVRMYLKDGRSYVNTGDKSGGTPLMIAASNPKGTDVVRVLLNYKGIYLNVNHQTTSWGATAFCMACRLGHTATVKAFLECKLHNIDFNLASHGGKTPLNHALEGRHTDVVRLLLQRCRVVEPLPPTRRPLTEKDVKKRIEKQKRDLKRKEEVVEQKENVEPLSDNGVVTGKESKKQKRALRKKKEALELKALEKELAALE